MTKRRSRGDGGLHWDERRQCWTATASLGYDGRGKRIVKRGSGKTKTEAKNKLKEVLRDYEDGLTIAPADFTAWARASCGTSGRTTSTSGSRRKPPPSALGRCGWCTPA